MDVNALLGDPTASAARAVSQLVNTPTSPAATAPAGAVPSQAPQIVDAPSATPAVEEADLHSLPLAIQYAPSSPPSDGARNAKFDRLA